MTGTTTDSSIIELKAGAYAEADPAARFLERQDTFLIGRIAARPLVPDVHRLGKDRDIVGHCEAARQVDLATPPIILGWPSI